MRKPYDLHSIKTQKIGRNANEEKEDNPTKPISFLIQSKNQLISFISTFI